MNFESTEVFETYWRFAVERQRMLMRRIAGEPPPWTDDKILKAYRFTNAYRVADRVSQYLVSEVIENEARSQSSEEIFFRVMLFKFFNRIETWRSMEAIIGRPIAWRGLDRNELALAFDAMHARDERIYSAAYIMPSPPYGHVRKHRNHLALLYAMMDDGLPDRVFRARSLAEVYELLRSWSGLGPFLAFQYAIDLNYSDIIDFEEDDFVVAGPGALDGISKCFIETGASPEDVIAQVCASQGQEFSRLGLTFDYLEGRRLKLIDCQNLFCEISKYTRVSHPHIEGRSRRTRIKRTYEVSRAPLPAIVLPRKWRGARVGG